METNINSIIENKIIVLNSKDGDKMNGDLLSNVRFNFRDILKKDKDIYYVSCSLLSCEIPVSFYNVNINNNILKYSINSIEYTLTVPEGNYSAITFISEFVSQFNSGGHNHTISVSFNKITGKLTTTKLIGDYDIIYLAEGTSIYEVLGFLGDTDYTISTSLVHSYMMNLLGVKNLLIMSSSFSLENHDSKGNTNSSLIHTVSVNQPSYSLIIYQNNNTSSSRVRNKIINEIDIMIKDENNNFVDFNNTNWCMSIILNIYRILTPPTDDNLNLNALAINIIQENTPLPTKTEIKEVLQKLDEDNLRELEFLSL